MAVKYNGRSCFTWGQLIPYMFDDDYKLVKLESEGFVKVVPNPPPVGSKEKALHLLMDYCRFTVEHVEHKWRHSGSWPIPKPEHIKHLKEDTPVIIFHEENK